MNYDTEVVITRIETRHDLDGNPVPVAIDHDGNEYICSWETLEQGGYKTERMKQMQNGSRYGVIFTAVDSGGEIASIVPPDPNPRKANLELLSLMLSTLSKLTTLPGERQ